MNSSLGGHMASDLTGVTFSDGSTALCADGANARQYGDQDPGGFAGWKVL